MEPSVGGIGRRDVTVGSGLSGDDAQQRRGVVCADGAGAETARAGCSPDGHRWRQDLDALREEVRVAGLRRGSRCGFVERIEDALACLAGRCGDRTVLPF